LSDSGHYAELLSQALQAYRRGDPARALGFIEGALRANPQSFEALLQRGLVLRALGRPAEALASYDKAVGLQPGSADALFNRGNALLALGRYQDALASYEQALTLKPGDAEALNNRGNALRALQRYEEALASYNHALGLVPGYAKALGNRGHALMALERHEEALASYRRAFSAAPQAAWMTGIGHALQALERPDEALASYARALAIEPQAADALGGRANALQALNRHEEALASCAQALAIDPDNAESNWNEALVRLTLGDYRRGWEKYEWRWLNPALGSPPRVAHRPLWLGKEDIAGKTILLHAEQGYGDTIQAIRYAPLVAARGARVIVACQQALRSLFTRVEGVQSVVKMGDSLPPFDYQVPLMSLPLAFGTTLETIPARVPYLSASATGVEAWRRRLAGPGGRFRVGLAWTGNPQFSRARAKSCPVACLRRLVQSADCAFSSLQTGEAAKEAVALACPGRVVVDHSRDIASFEDSAALISVLDLVITIDTAVAHLAGALGKPVWILLPFSADWRWLRERPDSPWYPSARLFRQPRAGDWDGVIDVAGRELALAARAGESP
jgi:tetratricopeptide (TPR) repeat protein